MDPVVEVNPSPWAAIIFSEQFGTDFSPDVSTTLIETSPYKVDPLVIRYVINPVSYVINGGKIFYKFLNFYVKI